MHASLQVSKIVALLALAVLLITLADVARQMPTMIHQESRITREALDSRVATEANAIRRLLDDWTRDALGEVRTATAAVSLRSEQVVGELATTRRTLLVIGLNLAGRADSRLGEVTSDLTGLRADLRPMIAGAAGAEASYGRLADSARSAVDDVHPETVKLLRDARITTAQAGRAASQIEHATPEVLANVKRATDASADASEHASATFANLEKQTKPGPLWLKVVPEIVKTAIIGIGFLR